MWVTNVFVFLGLCALSTHAFYFLVTVRQINEITDQEIVFTKSIIYRKNQDASRLSNLVILPCFSDTRCWMKAVKSHLIYTMAVLPRQNYK